MAGQRDLARKRLEQLIKFQHFYSGPWQETAFALEQEVRGAAIWDDPKARTCAAELALSLTSAASDEPIRKAFDSFGLDPSNPFHWRKLLWYLAEAFFGQRNLGRPKEWSADKLCHLLEHFHQVKEKEENLTLSDELICQRVKNHFHREYAGISAGTIRRNVQYARDPQRNPVLGSLCETYRRR
jgi:hypothetical protein